MSKPVTCSLDPIEYEEVVEHFIAGLLGVADHIETHDIIEDGARMVAELRAVPDLWKQTRDHDCAEHGHPGYPSNATDMSNSERKTAVEACIAYEEAAWDAFWDYLHRHVRGWWD